MPHIASYLRAFSIKVVQCLLSDLSLDRAVQTLNIKKHKDTVKECQTWHLNQTRAPPARKASTNPKTLLKPIFL